MLLNKNNLNELSYKYSFLILGILVFIGFFLRVYNIGFLSLWVDEYVHVNRAISFIEGGELFTSDNNGILLTIFIIPLFKFFGNSEFLARFPSVLFGTLTIPLIYFFTKVIFRSRIIGFISAVLLTFSTFHVYWSRVCRNYSIFCFFYLLFIFILYIFYEKKYILNGKGVSEIFLKYWNYLLLLVILLGFSIISHQLSLLFIFPFSIYLFIVTIFEIKNKKSFKLNKYSIIGIPLFLFIVFIFTPFFESPLRIFLEKFLPNRVVEWVIPDWNYLKLLYDESKTFDVFRLYYDVFTADFNYIYAIGFIGFIIAFFTHKKKEALFLLLNFLIPFLLLSFLFRTPALPRYIIFIYPFFIISIAISINFILNKTLKILIKENNQILKNILSVCIIFLCSINSIQKVYSFVTSENHGYLISDKLSKWYFTNWKEGLRLGKNFIQKGDVVITTMPSASNYYLGITNSIMFRQRYYDTKQKKYLNYEEPNNNKFHANTIKGLKDIIGKNLRGWFFVDYYFYNAMTDPNARNLVIQNCRYHFNLSKTSDVKVFSWDHSKPIKKINTMLIEIGKDDKQFRSQDLVFDNKENIKKDLLINLEIEGLDNSKEGFMVINNIKVPFPSDLDCTNKRKIYQMKIPKVVLKKGENILYFVYNFNSKVEAKGFVIYNIKINNV